ncbi:hypothetical protein L873DRAFT_1849616 [Choiromyces venosus 120613-1]|uniref:Uncharacterized protein n=1 Tax=Choiromyces venosus 120613-1 TaxID=1336337 RepID=A0A3N4IRD8_9PEZI|nr:hypothetical protein L873DRAFT_1849616 [Choiromyces venosus 120613-1]
MTIPPSDQGPLAGSLLLQQLLATAPSYCAPATTVATTVATSSTPDDLGGMPEIAGLIQAIQKHGPVQTVQVHLQHLALHEMVFCVVDILDLQQQKGEVLGLIVTHIWENYVVPEKLWEYYEGGESRFKDNVAYAEFIVPTLESAKLSVRQLEKSVAEGSPAPSSNASFMPLRRQRDIPVAG